MADLCGTGENINKQRQSSAETSFTNMSGPGLPGLSKAGVDV